MENNTIAYIVLALFLGVQTTLMWILVKYLHLTNLEMLDQFRKLSSSLIRVVDGLPKSKSSFLLFNPKQIDTRTSANSSTTNANNIVTVATDEDNFKLPSKESFDFKVEGYVKIHNICGSYTELNTLITEFDKQIDLNVVDKVSSIFKNRNMFLVFENSVEMHKVFYLVTEEMKHNEFFTAADDSHITLSNDVRATLFNV